jgi:hypothetical protein
MLVRAEYVMKSMEDIRRLIREHGGRCWWSGDPAICGPRTFPACSIPCTTRTGCRRRPRRRLGDGAR